MGLSETAHSFLARLPHEIAHSIAKFAMKWRIGAPGFYEAPTPTRLFDIDLPNPFGVAAGFDKYAELHEVIQHYGFGWIETGSFTFGGGEGNKGKRLDRLRTGNMWNRMGLNCVPAAVAATRYCKVRNNFSFAPSIAKTHDPSILGDRAINDIVDSYTLLKSFGIYTAINISCPNTRDGKTFEDPSSLKDLIAGLESVGKVRPVVFKFSPGLERRRLEELVEVSSDFADGYEAVNTLPYEYSFGKGGLSGPALRIEALKTVKDLRRMTHKPILGVGGISTGKEAYELRKVGANAFLSYTGFVYKHEKHPFAGPQFAWKINQDYERLLKETA